MKKQIPAIILAVIGIALAASLYSARQQIAQLKQQIADQSQSSEQVADAKPVPDETAEPVAVVETETVVTPFEAPAPAPDVLPEKEEPGGRRMMKNLAKMMENPAMNKMMEASQRGAIGAMYADLIKDLGLNDEETKYFMDLLMFRQMTQMDLGMKLMSGNLTVEEKEALTKELKDAKDLVKTEMKNFLNNEDDFSEYEFYENTMRERMMLSGMENKFADTDAALTDETYRNLLDMMHTEKKNFKFSSDLADDKNSDLSAERFSKENIESFGNDMDQLNEKIFEKAQNMLTPDQFEAFRKAIKTFTDMQKSQLEMAAQMFGARQSTPAQ